MNHLTISDFTGLRCEESVDDCDGRVCSGPGALPVDGIEVCHCECAIENRMAGENCDKRKYSSPHNFIYNIAHFVLILDIMGSFNMSLQ